MTLVQHSGSNSWFEQSASEITLPVRAFPQFDGTDWILATTGSQDGQFIPNENGDFILADVRAEVLLIASGSDTAVSTSGTRTKVLVASADDVTLSSDLTAVQAAQLFQDLAGNTVMVRSDNPELKLLAVAGDYITYEVD